MDTPYRKIYTRFWTDEKVSLLPTVPKFVALYLFAGKQTNRVGLYHFSLSTAAEDLSMKPAEFVKASGVVLQKIPWQFDTVSRVLYLPTWWRYNEPENPSVMIGALKDLDALPATPLVAQFLTNERCLVKQFNISQLRHCARHHPLHSVRHGVAHQEQEQEQQQEQQQEQKKGEHEGEGRGPELFPSLAPPAPSKKSKDLKPAEEYDDSWITEPWPSERRLVAMYNTMTAEELPAVQKLSESRREKIRQYLGQFPKQLFWERIFVLTRSSLFLRGKKPPAPPRTKPFLADFEWFLQKGHDGIENVLKVDEGKYGDKT